MATTDLPDINVWIALSVADHEHRERVEHYWRVEAAPRLALNSVTILGLVRVCSNAPLFDGKPLAPQDAWAIGQGWLGVPEVLYLPEPTECRLALGDLVSSGEVAARTWTDAYLAAFAMATGLRLVSFDADFQRFKGLDLLHLVP